MMIFRIAWNLFALNGLVKKSARLSAVRTKGTSTVFIIHRDQLQKKLLGDDYVTGQINCRVGYDWVNPSKKYILTFIYRNPIVCNVTDTGGVQIE